MWNLLSHALRRWLNGSTRSASNVENSDTGRKTASLSREKKEKKLGNTLKQGKVLKDLSPDLFLTPTPNHGLDQGQNKIYYITRIYYSYS